MGYTECHGRHSHSGGNDYAGTITLSPSDPLALIKILCTAEEGKWQTLQLRFSSSGAAYYRDKCTYWYLFFRKPRTGVHLTSC
jgi:hypothetical protein